MAILDYEDINKLLKPLFKIRQSKIALKQTLTLKLGVTLVLTVTQVYIFINLWCATLIMEQDVGMAFQKVCKQDKDDVKVKV